MRAEHLVLAAVLMTSSLPAMAGTYGAGHDVILPPRTTTDNATRDVSGGSEGVGSGGRDCGTAAGGADTPRDCGGDGGGHGGGSIDTVGARHHLSWQSLLPGSIQ